MGVAVFEEKKYGYIVSVIEGKLNYSKEPFFVLSLNEDDYFEVSQDQSNYLLVKFFTNNVEKTYIYQKVEFKDNGVFIFSFCWKGRIPCLLKINDITIKLYEECKKTILINNNQTGFKKSSYNFEIPNDALEVEKFFLEAFLEIQESISSDKEYKIFRASGLLRQLFLDGDNFYSKIGKINKLKFLVNDEDPDFLLDESIHLYIRSLEINPNLPTKEIKLDEFLNLVCYKSVTKNMTITVKDIIRAVANGRGGCHYGKIKNLNTQENENFVLDLDSIFITFGEKLTVIKLKEIYLIFLEALFPTTENILKKYN